MATKEILHMNAGHGETSYARNSTFQDRMKMLINEEVTGLCGLTSIPKSMAIADLGCSSGPNALTLVSAALDAIYHHCAQHQQPHPEMCVFLNDLPSNDFNSVAKSLATLKHSHDDLADPVVVTGMIPGSFYERLFPCGSLHFVCSSNSLHWLSKAPEDLKEGKIPMYDMDEHLRLSRRAVVGDAYARQFRKDFKQFLSLRAQELVSGGRMVISLYGRFSENPISRSNQAWQVVAVALNDMASRGIIDKEKLDSFYIPLYAPLENEVNEIIEDEGSFEINKMIVRNPFIGMDDASVSPKMIALAIRAVFESTIVLHFGSSEETIDEFAITVERNLSSGSGWRAVLAAEYPLVLLCLSLRRII
uniref:Jasmonate O-methyltransferase n=1 Tax=Oryza punctata TaxID=4537 RepID=A0A0E0LAZ3_ORYPU